MTTRNRTKQNARRRKAERLNREARIREFDKMLAALRELGRCAMLVGSMMSDLVVSGTEGLMVLAQAADKARNKDRTPNFDDLGKVFKSWEPNLTVEDPEGRFTHHFGGRQ